jgi:hypothetical protein
MRLHRAPRSGFAAVLAVGLLFILTNCGANSEPSQTSPPATTAAPPTTATPTAACADVAALKSSLDALTQVRLTEDGVRALTTAIADVKAKLDKAEASASPALQPAVQQVKAAFGDLQTAASGITAGNLREKAPAIAAAMKQVGSATQALRSTLTESCPGS